jgi:hypothetical protein
MAKLDFCSVAIDIRCALDEGRIPDAKRIAIEHLEAGYHSPEFSKIVAEIYKKKRSAQKKYKEHWTEIGEAFWELAGDDLDKEKYEVAIDVLVGRKWGPRKDQEYKRRTITKAVADYREGRRENDRLLWEEIGAHIRGGSRTPK